MVIIFNLEYILSQQQIQIKVSIERILRLSKNKKNCIKLKD
jgi:hypothetical protein